MLLLCHGQFINSCYITFPLVPLGEGIIHFTQLDQSSSYSSRCFPPACELDPSNHVLPTRRSETDHDVYSISPVGTAGFRSPEGSFLIVANDSAIIQPHLTPKADIWSFGVLLLRMFIWEDGPSSQREVC